ncbi:MAG: DUF805 domain-containing protein [Renibacterium sp.]|nr:DUF805 domain-containing protein [Renibacterium sp.]
MVQPVDAPWQPETDWRSQPFPEASLAIAVKRFYRRYSDFKGRSSRSEYWWVQLYLGLPSLLLLLPLLPFYLDWEEAASNNLADRMLGGTAAAAELPAPGPAPIFALVLFIVFWLLHLVPALALGVRRFHDANFSGWLILLNLVPFLGRIAGFVFSVLPSNPRGVRFDRP